MHHLFYIIIIFYIIHAVCFICSLAVSDGSRRVLQLAETVRLCSFIIIDKKTVMTVKSENSILFIWKPFTCTKVCICLFGIKLYITPH